MKKIVVYQCICVALLLCVIGLMAIVVQHNRPKEGSSMLTVKEATLSVIHNRKSVRDFVPNRAISEADIETILKAGMASPSGMDVRPWEFVVVDTRSVLDTLAANLPYAKMLVQSPVAIIVCGDTTKSSYWYVDCSAATENMLLAVEAMGLGAVWTAAYPYEDRMKIVAQTIALPDYILPLAVIPIGYPQGKQSPKDKYDKAKIHYNQWTPSY